MSELVYVVERFPERSQTFIQNELRELHRLGVRPRVFALYPPADADTTAGDLAHVRLPSAARRPLRTLLAVARVLARRPWGTLAAVCVALARPSRLQLHALAKAFLLVDTLGAQRPARLHAHFARASASTAMLAARMLGCRFSFTAHALDVFVRPFDMDRKLRAADVTVTVCAYNRQWMRERWPTQGRIEIVPCGVDPERFSRATPYGREPFTVVAVGRLVRKKGFDVLLRACAALRADGVALRCRILGDGPERPALEALADSLGVRDLVTLEGSVPPDVVREALEDASVFCLPCVIAPDGDRDSQPLVIKEAMAMEIPVVASDALGVPEMIDDAVGRLVRPADAGDLAAGIAALAALGQDERRALGEAGRRRVEQHFTLRAGAHDLVRLWDDAAAGDSSE